jgi:hypothetical protein
VEVAVRDHLNLYVHVHHEADTAVASSTEYKAGLRFRF